MKEIENYIAIVDYGIGNLHSVQRACNKVEMNAIITADKNTINNAAALILPGVGAFGDAMNNLRELDLVNTIKDFAGTGKYIMGVCLGMQLLMTESEEFGTQKGLNLIEGTCKRFPNSLNGKGKTIRVPQIMWNKIYPPANSSWEKSPLSNIPPEEFMYFVHSYYVLPAAKEHMLSLTSYEGLEYCSSIKKNNIFAFQFHPEKSGETGLNIYKNFNKIVNFGRE